MDPAAAAKMSASLSAELQRRQAKRDFVEDQQWVEQFSGDEIIILAKRLERDWDRRAKSPRPPVPMSVDDKEIALEEALEYARLLFSLAQAIERSERRREIEASGAPRRRPIVLPPEKRGPRMGYGADRPAASAKNGDGKPSKKLSRTEEYRLKLEQEAAARQALLPPRAVEMAPQEFWRRGLVQVFDSRDLLGVIKFAGLDGFTEAPVSQAVFMASGLTVLTPGMMVDTKLRRNMDGSVVVAEIRLASGTDPSASAAQQAVADAERFQIHLMRNKWMN